jgi:hypothetical protein
MSGVQIGRLASVGEWVAVLRRCATAGWADLCRDDQLAGPTPALRGGSDRALGQRPGIWCGIHSG